MCRFVLQYFLHAGGYRRKLFPIGARIGPESAPPGRPRSYLVSTGVENTSFTLNVASITHSWYVSDMDGIYVTYFTGVAGSGHALFMMKDGEIVGADAVGGVLDGTYKFLNSGRVDISATIKVPAGTSLVTGTLVEKEPFFQHITAVVSENFANGIPIPLQTSTGPVNAIFKRLRELP